MRFLKYSFFGGNYYTCSKRCLQIVYYRTVVQRRDNLREGLKQTYVQEVPVHLLRAKNIAIQHIPYVTTSLEFAKQAHKNFPMI